MFATKVCCTKQVFLQVGRLQRGLFLHNTSSWDIVAVSGGKDLLEGVRLWHLRSPGAAHRLTIGKQKKQDILPGISSTTKNENLSFPPECEYWRVPTTSKLPTQANNHYHIFERDFTFIVRFWRSECLMIHTTALVYQSQHINNNTQISISFPGKGFDVRGLRGHLVLWKGGELQLLINHQLWLFVCMQVNCAPWCCLAESWGY